jgi:DNA polymerase III delta subunit
MASYAQWRTSVDKGEVRRVIYVCGSERILVHEVVATTLNLVNPSHLDYVSLSAADAHTNEIWAAAFAYPLTPGAARLVYIRDADKVRSWAQMQPWFDHARRLPGVHLLFDSPAESVPDEPHLALIRARRHGQIVRCATPNKTDMIAWVRRRGRLDVTGAVRLLTRVGWSVPRAADACDKLTLFDARPSDASIDAVCHAADTDFIDALLAGDKPAALRVADTVDTSMLTTLAARVDLLARLHNAARLGHGASDIRGEWPHLVARYLPIARNYDPKRCAHIRQALAVTEDAYRSGARIGVPEALVAMW